MNVEAQMIQFERVANSSPTQAYQLIKEGRPSGNTSRQFRCYHCYAVRCNTPFQVEDTTIADESFGGWRYTFAYIMLVIGISQHSGR
jgi:DNA gyrase inhibitor GyrI